MRSNEARIHVGLFLGVAAVSFAAIFIRLAEAPALVIAAYRLGIASVIIAPWALARRRHEVATLGRGEWGLALASGLFLSLHFALWITSLSLTTVASSVVLVTMSPLMVGLASHFLTADRLSRGRLAGILVSVLGALVVGYGDFSLSPRALLGDALAFLAAVMVTGYMVIGRRLRARLSALTYVSLVYSVGALVLLLAVGGARLNLAGYAAPTYAMFLLLALVPQLLGHTLLNWSLGYVSATFITVAVLAEPVVSTALAYLLLNESPPQATVGGGALILAGIYFAFRAEVAGQRRRGGSPGLSTAPAVPEEEGPEREGA